MRGPLRVVDPSWPPPIIGVDREALPSQRAPGGTIEVTYIMTRHAAGVRCHRGVGTPQWVAAHGQRCNLATTADHFPLQAQWRNSWDPS